jgi:ABC-2 type transport system ATP-binding protein
LLLVEDASKSYGRITALDGVGLRVDPGQFVALLGPNGAGKSTLFQLLTGLFVADGGSIRIDGHDIRRDAVRALAGMGIVFQQPTLDLDLSALANLRFHASLHGLTWARAKIRVDAELTRLGIAERANDPARQLSGGNRRKLELARALVHEPRLLLLDEPTVGLDPASRRDLLAYVLDLRQAPPLGQRVGVLWATHLVDEAEAADQVVVLHKGKVLTRGTPAQLVKETGAASLQAAFLALTK